MILTIVPINGKDRYLIREDMINVGFLKVDDTPRLWPIDIDELVYRIADITNIETTLVDLTRTTVSSKHWCKIPTSYMGLYYYSLENTITSLRNNITRWLPGGFHVVHLSSRTTSRLQTQKTLLPSTSTVIFISM